MNDLYKIQHRVLNFLKEREWDKGRTATDDAMDVVVEAAEILEHFQWKKGSELEEYIQLHKDQIADEVADVLFSLCALSAQLKIDLNQAFDAKMMQNEKKYPVEKSKGNHKKYTEL